MRRGRVAHSTVQTTYCTTISLALNVAIVLACTFYGGYYFGSKANASPVQIRLEEPSPKVYENVHAEKAKNTTIVVPSTPASISTNSNNEDDDIPAEVHTAGQEEQRNEELYASNDDDGSAILQTAESFVCPQKDTLICEQHVGGTPQRVHVVSFHAVFGLHTNYYHWFFGRIVPFLHWLKQIKSNDIIIFVDKDERLLDKKIHYILDKLVAEHSCAIPLFVGASKPRNVDIRKTLSKHLKQKSQSIDAQLENLDVFDWPFERGVDLVMYGCGTLSSSSRKRLTIEVQEAYDFLKRSCSCCSYENASEQIVTLVDRGTDDKKRSIPNIGRVTTTLQRGLGKNVRVQRVNFGKMRTLCEQWCTVHASKVFIGQHGAGLTNAVMLHSKAGFVEIMPDAVSFKSMYHCLAKLRDTYYTQIFQNGTHGLVNPEDALKAVRTMLENSEKEKKIDLEFPDFQPSKHMLTMKCPSELGSRPESITEGQIGTTSLLVRSNECKNANIMQLPTKSCYRGYNDSKTNARTQCSYAIVSTITRDDKEMALDLFLRTLARVEKNSYRPVFFATDRTASYWLRKRVGMYPWLEIKSKYCADLDMYMPDGSPNPRYPRKKDLKPYNYETKRRARLMEMTSAMHYALHLGNKATLFVDINVIFLKPPPLLGPEHLGLIRDNTEYHSTFLSARNVPVLVAWRRAFIDREMSNPDSLKSMTSSFSHFFLNDDPKYEFEHIDEGGVHENDLELSTSSSNRHQELVWQPPQQELDWQPEKRIVTSVRFKEVLSSNTTHTPLFKMLVQTPVREDLCAVLDCSRIH